MLSLDKPRNNRGEKEGMEVVEAQEYRKCSNRGLHHNQTINWVSYHHCLCLCLIVVKKMLSARARHLLHADFWIVAPVKTLENSAALLQPLTA